MDIGVVGDVVSVVNVGLALFGEIESILGNRPFIGVVFGVFDVLQDGVMAVVGVDSCFGNVADLLAAH